MHHNLNLSRMVLVDWEQSIHYCVIQHLLEGAVGKVAMKTYSNPNLSQDVHA